VFDELSVLTSHRLVSVFNWISVFSNFPGFFQVGSAFGISFSLYRGIGSVFIFLFFIFFR
jgi:hypothetical protein